MKHEIRVIFGDTDQMGVVYYANYLRYFEAARAGYWRGLGKSYRDLEEWQVALPVIEAHCVYRQPARYEDLLVIDTHVSELRGASLRFVYRVLRNASPTSGGTRSNAQRCAGTNEALLAEGFTRHAVIGPDGRPRALPAALRDAIPPIARAPAR